MLDGVTETTLVHLVRHAQVENPQGVLYGRLPGFGLSELGRRMAIRLAEHFADTPLNHLRCSPLLRAQQTIAPLAGMRPELGVVTDERVIEAANRFEGMTFGRDNAALRDPRMFWHMRNPLRPSWGEPYTAIAARMQRAVADAAEAAGAGGQALILSHQLPIWTIRRHHEGRPLAHDPRRRQCTLASVTTLTLVRGRVVQVDYAEPCADLLPPKTGRRFRVGT
ncbi:MAG: histidine phosphatase family protein [Propionibacteriaceae bacterium]|nr:histidine phosphatase family protein [Propionibacteriaceae bacterium]